MQDTNKLVRDGTDVHKAQLAGNIQSILRSGQHTLIRRILSVIAIIGLFAMIASVIDMISTGQYVRFMAIAAVYLGLLIVAFVPGVKYGMQAGVLLFVLYVIGVFNLITAGLTGNGVLFILAASVLAPLFFGGRAGIIVTILSIGTVVVVAILFVNGTILVPKEVLPDLDDVNSWITGVIGFVMIGAMLTIPQDYILQLFTSALSQEQQLTSTLESERTNLEERIAERTEVVTRRARYLAASAVVASEAAGVIEDPGELLRRVVDLISEQFGFYHTGLFLNDGTGEWTELKAASSEGGQNMLARSHRLLIGSQGIVGYVALRGSPRTALDVGNDVVFFDNPDLPDTRSEIALPLMVRGEVIGVLDVQSTESQALDEEDIAVLQSLADQVALAISNARLYTLAQESIEAERRLRGALSREGWRDLLISEQNLNARSTASGVSSGGENWTPEMGTALQSVTPVVDKETQKRIAIPLRVSGQTIGVVAACKSPDAERWSGEEVNLLNTLTDQLNAAVERVRLYRQAQLIALRQRTITEVGARMRASLQLETMLQTAAREIREALDLGDVEIRLASPPVVAIQENVSPNENGVAL